MSCLSFIKSKERPPLEKKFSLPPPPQVTDQLKRKWGALLGVQTPSNGKSQNVEFSTESLTGSSSAQNIPSKSQSTSRVTRSFVGSLTGKSSSILLTAPINLTDTTNKMEDPIQLR